MKRANKIYILLGVLAAVCIAAVLMKLYEPAQEQIRSSNEVILALSASSVEKLSWTYGEEALAFHRNESNVWLYDGDSTFPVDQTEISALLSEFNALTARFVIEAVEDYGQYGLEEPVCTVVLETQESSHTVKLGDYSTIDGLRYASVGDGNVYLVTTDPTTAYGVTLSELFLHDSLPELETATKIRLEEKSQTVVLTYSEDGGKSYSTADVWFMDDKPLDTTQVNYYLQDISGLSLTSCVTYNASSGNLNVFGLDSPRLSIHVSYTTEASDGSNVHRSLTVHLGVGSDSYFARIGESELIYEITESEYQALLDYSYDDLRHTKLFTADFADVTAMDVTLDGAVCRFAMMTVVDEETEEEETVWKFGETEISISAIQSALKALSAASFTDEAPAGQEELRLTVYLTSDYKDTMEIVLYRQDGSYCLCQVNGESVALVSRSTAVTLIEAVNAIILN